MAHNSMACFQRYTELRLSQSQVWRHTRLIPQLKAEPGIFLWVPGQPGLHGKQVSSQAVPHSETLSQKHDKKNKPTKVRQDFNSSGQCQSDLKSSIRALLQNNQ